MKPEIVKKEEQPKKISLRVLDGQTEVAEEELQKLFSFVGQWSRELLTALAIAAVVFFAIKFFKEADLRQQKASAQKFSDVRETYGELAAAVTTRDKTTGDAAKKEQEKVDAAKNKLTEQLKVLGDAREPYKSLGALYQALMLQRTGDVEGAKAIVAGMNIDQVLAKPDSNNLSVELTAITLARTLLDNDASYKDGWNLLVTLASKGQFAQVQAVKTLKTIATTEDEKKQADDLQKAFTAQQPAMAELLTQ